jgi:hypothetical protein
MSELVPACCTYGHKGGAGLLLVTLLFSSSCFGSLTSEIVIFLFKTVVMNKFENLLALDCAVLEYGVQMRHHACIAEGVARDSPDHQFELVNNNICYNFVLLKNDKA